MKQKGAVILWGSSGALDKRTLLASKTPLAFLSELISPEMVSEREKKSE